MHTSQFLVTPRPSDTCGLDRTRPLRLPWVMPPSVRAGREEVGRGRHHEHRLFASQRVTGLGSDGTTRPCDVDHSGSESAPFVVKDLGWVNTLRPLTHGLGTNQKGEDAATLPQCISFPVTAMQIQLGILDAIRLKP